MTDTLLAILRTAFDPRWWVLALLVWTTRDLVLAGKLSGDAWAVLMTVAGAAMGVSTAAGREIAVKMAGTLSKKENDT